MAAQWRHQWLDDDDGSVNLEVAALAASAGQFLLRAPEQCDFILEPVAGTITVVPSAELAHNTLEHLLLDQAIPRLLDGQEQLVLHASLVRVGAGCLAFVGRSGRGKSTLSAMLHQRGYPALCDDCAVLDCLDNVVHATPSYPGFRLYSDSIDAALETQLEACGPVSDYSDKQRIISVDLAPEMLAPCPVTAIYLLDTPALAKTDVAIQPLTRAAACMSLIEHTFRLDPSDHARTARLLAQASTVAQAVPIFLLGHPHDFARQQELIDAVLQHSERLPARST